MWRSRNLAIDKLDIINLSNLPELMQRFCFIIAIIFLIIFYFKIIFLILIYQKIIKKIKKIKLIILSEKHCQPRKKHSQMESIYLLI
jgi:hypothetical protein